MGCFFFFPGFPPMTRLATPTAAPPPSFPVRRFSVGEYHRMIAAGILAEDEPIELLDGWIVTKIPKNPRHDAVIPDRRTSPWSSRWLTPP